MDPQARRQAGRRGGGNYPYEQPAPAHIVTYAYAVCSCGAEYANFAISSTRVKFPSFPLAVSDAAAAHVAFKSPPPPRRNGAI